MVLALNEFSLTIIYANTFQHRNYHCYLMGLFLNFKFSVILPMFASLIMLFGIVDIWSPFPLVTE